MRRLKCFGLLFISLVAVSLLFSVICSQNVNAAVLDVTNADVIFSGAVKIETCTTLNCTDSQYNASTWNYVLHQPNLYSIRTERDFELKKGDIVEWYLVVRGRLDPSIFAQHYVVTYPGYLGNSYTATVSWENVIDSSFVANANLQPYTVGSGSSAQTYYSFTEEGYLYQIVRFTQVIKNDSDNNRKAYIGNASSQIMTINVYPTTDLDAYTAGINLSVGSLTVYRPSHASEDMNEKDNQDRENIESASDAANDAGASSSSDASSTGTTLLGAFSSFVSVLQSATPSNCNIDMDLGNLDLGVVNLCSLSPPTGFQTLASIFMILFCVPLSIATARKVINLFRSFQG